MGTREFEIGHSDIRPGWLQVLQEKGRKACGECGKEEKKQFRIQHDEFGMTDAVAGQQEKTDECGILYRQLNNAYEECARDKPCDRTTTCRER